MSAFCNRFPALSASVPAVMSKVSLTASEHHTISSHECPSDFHDKYSLGSPLKAGIFAAPAIVASILFVVVIFVELFVVFVFVVMPTGRDAAGVLKRDRLRARDARERTGFRDIRLSCDRVTVI